MGNGIPFFRSNTVEKNIETYIVWFKVVSEKTAAWLFERNEETVLQWMEENGLNWGNFTDLNTSRPESKGKVIHKAIKSWAIDTVRRYLNSHPLQNS